MHAHESSDPKKVPDSLSVHPAGDTHVDGRSARPSAQLSAAALLSLQRAVGNAAVARLHGEQGAVQRSTVPDVVGSPGRPLAEPVRTEMESRLGADFSDVRVHTDEAARHSTAEINARAYTSGSHVVLGEGGTDRRTLAHELVHVLQQRVGPVSGSDTGHGLQVSDPADRFEREADAVATRALSRAPSDGTTPTDPVTAQTPGAGDAQVQRAPTKRAMEGVEQEPASSAKRVRSVSPMTTEDDDLYGAGDLFDFETDELLQAWDQGHVGTEQAQAEPASRPAGEEPPEVAMEDAAEDSSVLPDLHSGEMDLASRPGNAGPEQVRAAPKPAPEKKTYAQEQEELRQVKNRDSRLRMLDRVARTLIEGIGTGKGLTPHLAVRFGEGALHVEGNEGKPITSDQKERAVAALKEAFAGGFKPGPHPSARFRRDSKKLRALLRGTYNPKDLDPEWMDSIASALRGFRLDWGDRAAGDEDGTASKARRVHAEMNLLGDIVAEWRRKERSESDEQAAGEDRKRTPVFLGGNKMPCGACRWVIDAVNDVIGKYYGFEVVVTKSHGKFYEWDLPRWLVDSTHELDQQVRQEVEQKAILARREIKNGKLLRAGNASGSHRPPWSDSEGED